MLRKKKHLKSYMTISMSNNNDDFKLVQSKLRSFGVHVLRLQHFMYVLEIVKNSISLDYKVGFMENLFE